MGLRHEGFDMYGLTIPLANPKLHRSHLWAPHEVTNNFRTDNEALSIRLCTKTKHVFDTKSEASADVFAKLIFLWDGMCEGNVFLEWYVRRDLWTPKVAR